MFGIVYNVVARICIFYYGLALPTSTGELELGGQMQTEVDGGNAVVDKVHLDALCLPVAQRVLVACNVDVIRQVLAAKLNVDGAAFLAKLSHQVLGTKHDVVVQGCCHTGHEIAVMVIVGEIMYGSDGVFVEV